MTLSELDLSPWAWRAFAFVWGCLWGSFVNVVVYRLPREMSVVHPPSHCPGCGAPVRPWDNVPVVSWLVLRGKARCCGTRISPRYAVIELAGGLLAVAVAERTILSVPGGTALGHALSAFAADFALAMALVAAAFIDLENMYLPDSITLGGTAFGLLTPGLRDLGWTDVILAAVLGFAGIWLLFIVGYKALRGRPGMGMGDAKLVMLAGAWFGWRGAVFALFAGSVQATLAATAVLLTQGRIEEPEAVRAERTLLQEAAAAGDEEAKKALELALEEDPLALPPGEGFMAARIPFGPFLCLAILEWMLAGEWIRERIGWLL